MGKEYKADYLLKETWTIPGSVHIIPEIDFQKLGDFLGDYFKITFSYPNFLNWLLKTSDGLVAFTRVLIVLVSLLLVLFLLFQMYFEESHLEYKVESKPLILYKRFKEGPLKFINQKIKNYYQWFKNSIYLYIFITLLIFNFALPFIVIDIITEYFYFFTSFDFISVLDTLIADIITLYQGIAFLPIWIKLLILYIFIRLLT